MPVQSGDGRRQAQQDLPVPGHCADCIGCRAGRQQFGTAPASRLPCSCQRLPVHPGRHAVGRRLAPAVQAASKIPKLLGAGAAAVPARGAITSTASRQCGTREGCPQEAGRTERVGRAPPGASSGLPGVQEGRRTVPCCPGGRSSGTSTPPRLPRTAGSARAPCGRRGTLAASGAGPDAAAAEHHLGVEPAVPDLLHWNGRAAGSRTGRCNTRPASRVRRRTRHRGPASRRCQLGLPAPPAALA